MSVYRLIIERTGEAARMMNPEVSLAARHAAEKAFDDVLNVVKGGEGLKNLTTWPEAIAQSTRQGELALAEAKHHFAQQRKLMPGLLDETPGAAKHLQRVDRQSELITTLDNVGIRAANPFKVRASQRPRWYEESPIDFSGTRFHFLDMKPDHFYKFSLHKPNDTLVSFEKLPDELSQVLTRDSRVTMQYLYSRPGAISPHIHDAGPMRTVTADQLKLLLSRGNSPELTTQAFLADRTAPAAFNLHVRTPGEFTTYHFDRALSMSRSLKPTAVDDTIQKSQTLVEGIQTRNLESYERLFEAGRKVDIPYEWAFGREALQASKVKPAQKFDPIASFDSSGYHGVPVGSTAKLSEAPLQPFNRGGFAEVPLKKP